MVKIKAAVRKGIARFMKKPLSLSLLAGFLLGFGAALFVYLSDRIASGDLKYLIKDFIEIAVVGTIIGFFFIYPLILTLINGVFLFLPGKRLRQIEYVTVLFGAVCTALYISISEIHFSADWTEQLYNAQKHTPINTQALPTVAALLCVAAIGYAVLNFIPLKKLPPLVIVLSFSALYIGVIEAVLWAVQISGVRILRLSGEKMLVLYPVNCVLVICKLMQCKMREWAEWQVEVAGQSGQETEAAGQGGRIAEKTGQGEQTPGTAGQGGRTAKFLSRCRRLLMKSSNWPAAALVLMLPLFSILTVLLVLFGQQPDAAVRAWTETSDWALSMRNAPQNLYMDEHYLCTVAAGGHRKIVKPLRMGERHGHAVIVNRQLCVANAFEQLLEERTPRFHRHLRHFYDTCGFPVARLIRSPYAADAVYVIMKPLEWLFLVILYLCDVRPENRIAVQYLPERGMKRETILL